MQKIKFWMRAGLPLLLALAIVLSSCQPAPAPTLQPQDSTDTNSPRTTDTSAPPPTQTSSEVVQPIPTPTWVDFTLEFARFNQPPVDTTPSISHEAIAADLSNVHNPFVLSQAQIDRLARDGFVVTPGMEKEFFMVYEKARYANAPIFVTSDSLLHSYHLLFDKVLRTAERERFIPLLRDLNAALLETADLQYQALKDGSWEEPARRTVAFIAVASRLLDPGVEIPDYAAELAQAELALIEDAAGILPSPLFPHLEFGEDYTQYIPRGHYTMSEDLEAYFKSMMWYGRMTFRLKTRDPEAGRLETRSALLLVQALRTSQVNGRSALGAWADLYSPTVFFVGRSDDLTVEQYLPVIDAVYGPGAGLQQLTDDSKLDAFIEQANQLPPPKILGIVIGDWDDVEEQTKGLRFMGQRFVPDAYIFRQLIYRNVGTQEDRRGLPNGLDIPAAMGSDRAYEVLDEMGETAYLNYPEQMEKVRSWLTSLTVDEWTETLYNGWMYTFYPLLDVPGEGYPAFMRSQAWLDKQLNTMLGSWAELKHDTILYAKQVYAEMGGGPPPPEPVPPKGYVEPVPEFYARLLALTTMTREGLDSRGLLTDLDRSNLTRLEELARAFKLMAEKELRGEALTPEEQHTIRFYGGELEHLVMASADSDNSDPFGQRYMDEEPQAAVIADVATDPDPDVDGIPGPAVLEVGVGRINEIHAVVPIVDDDGSIFLQVAKGGVFSYYEFPWPGEDRLTDEKWREMLEKGEAPPLPKWTGAFFTQQSEYSNIQLAIKDFHRDLVNAFWGVGFDNPLMSEALAPIEPQLETLKQNTQYEGRQLVSINIGSYDFQSENRILVTTQETWLDKRYEGDFPEDGDPVVAQRGPYTLNVTYTLERTSVEGQSQPMWLVSQFDYLSQPPDWESVE